MEEKDHEVTTGIWIRMCAFGAAPVVVGMLIAALIVFSVVRYADQRDIRSHWKQASISLNMMKLVYNDPNACGPTQTQCSPHEVCDRGRCISPCQPLVLCLCNGACVDIRSNAKNCGSCGNECGKDQACEDGICKNNCDGNLVDLLQDRDNCGLCGNACFESSHECKQGICRKPLM